MEPLEPKKPDKAMGGKTLPEAVIPHTGVTRRLRPMRRRESGKR